MIKIAITPYPITFTINDTAASALEDAKVYVRNITKRTTSDEAITDSNGQAVIDLANLPGTDPQYETDDVLLLIAYHEATKTSAGIQYTVTGSSKSQTLQLFNVDHSTVKKAVDGNQPGVRLKQVSVASTTTAGYCKTIAISDGEIISWIECPANDFRFDAFGSWGKTPAGGFIIEVENTTLKPIVTFK